MIAGIVLAAGTASRMGPQKLLLPVGGQSLIRLSLERLLASSLDDVVVVLGREAEAVGAALAGLRVRTVVNPAFAEGLSTSLRAGLDALDPAVEAAVVALGDQPLPDPAVVERLVAAYRGSGRPIVVPTYRGARGHPVLFAAEVFAELRAVRGDQGAREVIARDPDRVAVVPLDLPAPRDVDTWEDYRELLTEAARAQERSGAGGRPRPGVQ